MSSAHQGSDVKSDILLHIKDAEEQARTLVSEAMDRKDVLIREAAEKVAAWEAKEADEIRTAFADSLKKELDEIHNAPEHSRKASSAATIRQAAEKKRSAALDILSREFDVLITG
ncbi:MAG: hypothetical protein KKA90_01415 [Nanoarchaeota archaeon]|nr:hypothetical protein [Nanoarchaeota archaeon]